MKRGPKPVDHVSETELPIGYLATPIETDDLQRIAGIFQRHQIRMRKMRTPDNWWMLFFPDESRKRMKEVPGKVTTSTIRLPDGFSFLVEEGSLNRDGTFDIPPKIFVKNVQEDAER